ncbi:MAG: hypothetical protein FWH17_05675 [Oscillospiraceae bacterium]|nr:hypothetical protein [Oscillospiraceae bacterium]
MKCLIILLLLISVFLLTACQTAQPTVNTQSEPSNGGKADYGLTSDSNQDTATPSEQPAATQADTAVEGWTDLYYRVDHQDYIENVVKIRSVEELRESYEIIQPQNLSRVFEELFFNDDQYGEVFFENRFLVFIVFPEGSGSIRHKVTALTEKEGVLRVQAERHIPEAGTEDMAGWIIAIDLDVVFAELDVTVGWENVPMDVSQFLPPV